ncbi:hypothetical protein NC653_039572 [Populus alba x Populus x berolinensis]|uniref:Uncharacterized protein n=1 Tax=Populus alba x Populus x berolinensis TaxID=444605 RepID=A0AAD6LBL1_9ROSI|nr:hypothetical protein NC653_039572 [Populus alba x Populus x berolinensis]
MLCIAVPCHMFKLWAFIGIMFQVPLVVITKFLQNKFKSSMTSNSAIFHLKVFLRFLLACSWTEVVVYCYGVKEKANSNN